MTSHSRFLWIGAFLVVAALNSVLLFIIIPQASKRVSPSYNVEQSPDGYDQLATNLATGKGYRFYPDTAPTLLREPGYPVLLAGVFIAFGRSFTAIKLANMLLAFSVAYFMTLLARKASDSRLVIFGSPLLFLIHPETVIAESRGGVEILFALMLTLFILTLYRAIQTGRLWDYLASGAVLGLTALVRSTVILLPLAVLAYLLIVQRGIGQRGKAVRNATVMAAAMFVMLFPWIGRNYSLTAKFVPTTSILGVAAHTGLYLSTHRVFGNVLADTNAARERSELAHDLGYRFKDGYYQYFYASADEVAFSQYLFKRVLDEYANSPLLFIRTVFYNLFNFWCGGKTWQAAALDAIVQFPLVALALMAVVLWTRNGRVEAIAPLALTIVYIVAASAPILAQARYSAPLIPFLSILACGALSTAWRRFSGAGSARKPDGNIMLGLSSASIDNGSAAASPVHSGTNP
jgi:4-amino-4-deoxy-L-arabinose transferase-like glycosyltransferase